MTTRQFQISPSLIEIADSPVGDLPVVYEETEIGRAQTDPFGMCVFQIEDSLNKRIEIGDLVVTPNYVTLEADPEVPVPRKVRLIGIEIVDRGYFEERLISEAAASCLLGMPLKDSVTSSI